MLEVPERLGQVDVVGLRVLESEVGSPQLVDLLSAGLLDRVDIRLFVYELALLEDRNRYSAVYISCRASGKMARWYRR